MKKILLAIDGSAQADEASHVLSRLVHDEAYELVVLTVLPAVFADDGSKDELTTRDLEQRQRLAKDAFEQVAEHFEGANVTVRHLIRFGRPAERIVSVAAALKVELIVLGAIGHSLVERMLLGSVSDYVATHAQCSVLVVRPTGLRDSNRRLRVLLGYECTGPARAAMEELAEFHWGAQTDFDIATVLNEQVDFTYEDVMESSVRQVKAQAAIEDIRQELHDIAPVSNGHMILANHVGNGLVDFATRHDTDLVVVGETKQSVLGRALLGSASRFVLRHAPCSVWITRNRLLRGSKLREPHREAASAK